MSDKKVEQAVSKLLGKRRYAVAVRITGYYNIEVEADDEDDAFDIAWRHNYTMDDLSYQGDVDVDDIEEVEHDRAD